MKKKSSRRRRRILFHRIIRNLVSSWLEKNFFSPDVKFDHFILHLNLKISFYACHYFPGLSLQKENNFYQLRKSCSSSDFQLRHSSLVITSSFKKNCIKIKPKYYKIKIRVANFGIKRKKKFFKFGGSDYCF